MNNKINTLEHILKGYKRVLVAFSGGVDSSFLLSFALRTLGRNNVLAVTAVSETYPSNELKFSKSLAAKLKIKHIVIRTKELDNKNYSSNPYNRCFFCKDELFKKLSLLAIKNKMTLCDATNYSDINDYRPGQKAAKKWKVKSPLKEAGVLKPEIRYMSKKMKLLTWDMPAQACLASRIPYNTVITKKLLKRIERAELFLKDLGFKNVRIRHHDTIARIELDKDKIKDALKYADKISGFLKKLGWNYITLDIEGYRTGSLNLLVASHHL